jgi:hypothetical protein
MIATIAEYEQSVEVEAEQSWKRHTLWRSFTAIPSVINHFLPFVREGRMRLVIDCTIDPYLHSL